MTMPTLVDIMRASAAVENYIAASSSATPAGIALEMFETDQLDLEPIPMRCHDFNALLMKAEASRKGVQHSTRCTEYVSPDRKRKLWSRYRSIIVAETVELRRILTYSISVQLPSAYLILHWP